MGNLRARAPKRRSFAQNHSLQKAQEARRQNHIPDTAPRLACNILSGNSIVAIQESRNQAKLKEKTRQVKNEKQRNQRLAKANEGLKATKVHAGEEAKQLQARLMQRDAEVATLRVHADDCAQKINALRQSNQTLTRDRARLKKQNTHIRKAKERSIQRALEKAKKKGRIFQIMRRGVYTSQARRVARYMVSVGTSESKVGEALREIGKAMGVGVERTMSQRTVQRAVLEAGIAADIQLGYEMSKSDSTYP